MRTLCTFQTDDEALQDLWNVSISVFEELDDTTPSLFTSAISSLGIYTQLALMLSADVDRVEKLLDRMYAHLLEEDQCDGAYGYALAVYSFASYTQELERVTALYHKALTLLQRVECPCHDAILYAHHIGAKMLMQKVAYLLGEKVDRVSLGGEISTFHSGNFNQRQGLYTTPMVNVLAAFYGFLSDDGEETVEEWLTEHSFEIPKEERFFLYGALNHLESYDGMISTILEAGNPKQEGATPAHLAGVNALLTMVCGIDVGMLAKGIRCMQPHLPDHISFRAVLPSPDGPIYFDLGELLFDEGYFS